MNGRVHAEAKAASKSSFTPVMTSLLQRKSLLDGVIGLAGEFADSRGRPLVSQPPLIQAKLTINQPNDQYEQEADRVTDAVMRMPEPDVPNATRFGTIQRIQRTCIGWGDGELRRQLEEEKKEEELIQTKPIAEQITPFIQRQVEEEDEEEEEFLQTKTYSSHIPEVTSDIASRIQSLKGDGQPLSESTSAFFEPRFGQDFSQVRVHTDARAAKSARVVNAKAFTTGTDVVFSTGQYSPDTATGKRLLAHELTHVVQQGDKPFRSIQRNEDERYLPTTSALSAVGHAYSMMTGNIWFDSWGNDLRDNNLDGSIDNSPEQGLPDGTHYYGGTRTYDAKVCSLGFLRTDQCPNFTQSNIDVYYKVCIDVPKEAYAAAGISMPSTRRIRNIIPWFCSSSSFQTWTKPSLPTIMVPGDFVAVQSGGHSHSGIVPGFGLPRSWLVDAIHLPGPTSRRSLGGQWTYWPSSKNDVFRTPWPHDIDFVARPTI